MASRIIFLGTGGDSYVAGRQIRASGGIIIQDGEIQLHIDPGPGAIVRAAENGINPRENTAVIVTNNNILHSNDINAVIDAMTYGGFDKKGVLVANPSLVNGTEGKPPLLTNFHKNCLERVIVMQPGQKLGIENLEIHATKSYNEHEDSLGLKIFTTESVIGYTSNTKYTKELASQYQGVDILIINIVMPTNEKAENRMGTDDAIKLIKQVNPKLAIITGFGIKMIKADPLSEGREIQKTTGIQILTAKDGMSLIPGSYAARSKQKRLNLYDDKTIDEQENTQSNPNNNNTE